LLANLRRLFICELSWPHITCLALNTLP
jgi:hypothetical protein